MTHWGQLCLFTRKIMLECVSLENMGPHTNKVQHYSHDIQTKLRVVDSELRVALLACTKSSNRYVKNATH